MLKLQSSSNVLVIYLHLLDLSVMSESIAGLGLSFLFEMGLSSYEQYNGMLV